MILIPSQVCDICIVTVITWNDKTAIWHCPSLIISIPARGFINRGVPAEVMGEGSLKGPRYCSESYDHSTSGCHSTFRDLHPFPWLARDCHNCSTINSLRYHSAYGQTISRPRKAQCMCRWDRVSMQTTVLTESGSRSLNNNRSLETPLLHHLQHSKVTVDLYHCPLQRLTR